jgi:hypothetical protein
VGEGFEVVDRGGDCVMGDVVECGLEEAILANADLEGLGLGFKVEV